MNSFRLYLVGHIVRILPDTRCFGLKRTLYRWCGVKVGKNVRICSSVVITGDGELSIGDNTWIGHQSFILSSNKVIIGQDVNIAPRVYIGTGTHEIDLDGSAIAGKGVSLPITIGDGVWLCANATIIAGVSIGKKTIIAAGAVITKNVGSCELWGGVPANHIKSLKTNDGYNL